MAAFVGKRGRELLSDCCALDQEQASSNIPQETIVFTFIQQNNVFFALS
jgi:hypothetical protein